MAGERLFPGHPVLQLFQCVIAKQHPLPEKPPEMLTLFWAPVRIEKMLAKYGRFVVKKYLFSVIALIFVCVYWASASKLPEKSIVFPRAVTFILIPLFIWNFSLSIKQFRKLLADGETPEEKKWNCTLRITKPKLTLMGMTIVYALCIPVIGYCVSTLVYIASMTYYLGERRPAKVALFTVILFAVLYAIFGVWLRVRLPAGFLI